MVKFRMFKVNSVVSMESKPMGTLKDETYLAIKRELEGYEYFCISVKVSFVNDIRKFYSLNDFLAYFKYADECDVGRMAITVKAYEEKGMLNCALFSQYVVEIEYD